jgi:tetratricopeptide (TPR) repeat protein
MPPCGRLSPNSAIVLTVGTRAERANRDINRCWARALLAQQSAIPDCNEALRLKPNNASFLDSRGFAYFGLGQLDAAVADYDAALRRDPKAAKTIEPNIVDEFARFGVKAPE